jgi:hypothetical protein
VRFAERLVASDGDRGPLLPLGEYLEEKFGAAAVEFHVSQLVQAEKIHSAVAGDRLGQLLVVGGLDQLVDQLGGKGVADPVAGHRGLGAKGDQQVRLAAALPHRPDPGRWYRPEQATDAGRAGSGPGACGRTRWLHRHRPCRQGPGNRRPDRLHGPSGRLHLRKLRGKNLLVKPGRSRRYQVPPQAARTIAGLLTLRDQVIGPILAGVRSPRLGRKPAHWTAIDRDYETLRIGMQTLFADLGITASAAA